MTTPRDPGGLDPDRAAAIGLLVREALARVAEQTLVAEGGAASALPRRPTEDDVAPGDAGPDMGGSGVVDLDQPNREGGRRWPLLVAAAFLVIALAGVVIRSIDDRSTTEVGPAATTDADVTATDPTTTEVSSTILEPSACSAWTLVEHHLRESGDVFDAGSAEDLLAFRGFAPAELHADTDRLLELAAATPPPPERAEILARLRADLSVRCGPPAGG